ncbi:MAG TPA: T9SS type A sorting domain-containing protein, partial [Bacteroidia bacterium]|nr:T9SS type A sorting domain-containing protein [Bacteroidia bacterium]
SGNGPGTIIYQERDKNPYYAPDTPNRFATYTLDSGLVIVSGTFYVGWQQEGVDRLYIGMDFENDQHDKIYYNTSGVWYTSIYAGALMMRPVFGNAYDLSGVHEENQNSLINVYPNPATENLTIAGMETGVQYTAAITDVSGRTIISQAVNTQSNVIDVSALAPGMYILNVSDEKGILTGVEKIIVQ